MTSRAPSAPHPHGSSPANQLSVRGRRHEAETESGPDRLDSQKFHHSKTWVLQKR
jgi:hypothetical protein